jgi:periplasmic divalent cation tolerance protein
MADEHLLVLCTCPGNTVAAELATALIEQNLAGCVNRVTGLKSWYRWEGRLRQEDEVLLLIKTTRVRYPEVEAMVRRLHPYELPEVIAVPITGGSEAYLGWLSQSTGE